MKCSNEIKEIGARKEVKPFFLRRKKQTQRNKMTWPATQRLWLVLHDPWLSGDLTTGIRTTDNGLFCVKVLLCSAGLLNDMLNTKSRWHLIVWKRPFIFLPFRVGWYSDLMGGDSILFHELKAMFWLCSWGVKDTNGSEMMIFQCSVLYLWVWYPRTQPTVGQHLRKKKSIFPQHIQMWLCHCFLKI